MQYIFSVLVLYTVPICVINEGIGQKLPEGMPRLCTGILCLCGSCVPVGHVAKNVPLYSHTISQETDTKIMKFLFVRANIYHQSKLVHRVQMKARPVPLPATA
jgi:hypothetical protein